MIYKKSEIIHKLQIGSLTVLSGLLLTVFLSASNSIDIDKTIAKAIKQDFIEDCTAFKRQATVFTAVLEEHEEGYTTAEQVKKAFFELKTSYKRIEYIVEYLDQDLAKGLNGAPIEKIVVEDAPYLSLKNIEPVFVVLPPNGLQVIEEILFADEITPDLISEAISEAYLIEEKIMLFRNSLIDQTFSDKQILESYREQIVRAMTLGITGFDVPATDTGIENTAISLEPVLKGLKRYQLATKGVFGEESTRAAELIENAIVFLHQNHDFDTFDRAYFIKEIADPGYGALSALQQHLEKTATSESFFSKPVNDDANSLFSVDFLLPGFYSKQDQKNKNPELKNLGKMLFFDPVLSSNNKRSCASCHKPSMAFTDGLPKSLAFDFEGNVRRNAPTLINAIFSTAYFWDGRTEFLQDQVPQVVNKEDELHGSYEQVVDLLNQSKEYRQLFQRAFAGHAENDINTNTINRAIAAYVQSLVALNSPFDRYMRKENDNLDSGAIRGFNLFMGKANCGTCHFAPVFNGTVPPRYLESETEVLGVPHSPDFLRPILDADSGRAEYIKATALLHSFKTTTIRNSNLTAPYMHNGAFATLEDVMEFYDLGGGQGIGLDVPNQTLPADPLHLTAEEKNDIIAFMISLTDTVATAAVPGRLPAFRNNDVLNKRIIGGEY